MKKYWLVPVSLLTALLFCCIEIMALLFISACLFPMKSNQNNSPAPIPFASAYTGTRWIVQETDLYVDVNSGYGTGTGNRAVLIVEDEQFVMAIGWRTSINGEKGYFVHKLQFDSEEKCYKNGEELFMGSVEWLVENESFIFHISHCDLLGDLEQLTFVRARIPFAELPQNAPKKYQFFV